MGWEKKKISIAPDKTVVEERGWWGDGIGSIDVVEGLIELAFPFHHCVLLVLFFSFLLSRNHRRWDFTWGDNVGCFVHLLSAPVGSNTGCVVAVVVFDVEGCALGEVSFLPLIFCSWVNCTTEIYTLLQNTYRIGCPFLFPGLLPAPARKSFSTLEMGGRVGLP